MIFPVHLSLTEGRSLDLQARGLSMTIKSCALIFALLFSLHSVDTWGQALTALSKRVQNTMNVPETQNDQEPASLMSLSGPILGLVFDESKSGLRPIFGIPGASRLGNVWVLGRDIQRAWISPPQDYALAESKPDGSIVLVSFGKGTIVVRPIKGVASGVGNISLSANGGVAAIYYPRAGGLQFITGLPVAPLASALIPFSALPQSATAMAVSDDGEAVLLATAEQKSGSLLLLTRDSQTRVLTLLGKASAISFLSGTHNALIADEQNNAVLLIQDVTGAAITSTVAGASEGIAHPLAVEASEDNRLAFIANGRSRSISTVDLQSGRLSSLACNCTPTGLHRLKGNAVFRLNELSDANLQLFDAGVSEPRVLFVPAEAKQPAAPGGTTVPDRGQSRPIQIRPPRS
jgi:hypothetical protein